MDPNVRLLLIAANDSAPRTMVRPPKRRAFSVEIDRRGVFATLGPFEAYLCGESEKAWFVVREPDCLDVQLWRLHLILSRVPR